MGPQLKVVEKARTATMLCAASGNPDPEISWFKDFLPVDTATSNGRIKQLRSGKAAKQVSISATTLFLPLLLMQLFFFVTLKYNSKLNCQFDERLLLLQHKTKFGADPVCQDIVACYKRWAWTFVLEHQPDSFFCRPTWHCHRSLLDSVILLPAQQVSATLAQCRSV